MQKKSIERKQGFWTVNRKLTMISMIVPTMVFWALMQTFKFDGVDSLAAGKMIGLIIFLHFIYPILATKFLAANVKLLNNKSKVKRFVIGQRSYTRLELERIAITIAVGFIPSGWIVIPIASLLHKGLIKPLPLAIPYLVFHIFCFIKNHSPSIIRALAAAPFSKSDNSSMQFNDSISSSRAYTWGSSYSGTGPNSYHHNHYISRR